MLHFPITTDLNSRKRFPEGFMLGKYENIDRRIKEPKLEPIDAIMLTLDAEKYLEMTLDATYREAPINKFIVVDGGSTDRTLEILRKYPRIEIHVKPDIKTTGKGIEFLLDKVTTPWVLLVDCAKVPANGWYDEMAKYKNKYDFYGSRRINHYEFEREDETTTNLKKRPLGGPWILRKEATKSYRVDDDYAWRIVDVIIRNIVEKNGYIYGTVPTTYHTCYITEGEKYASDEKKRGTALVFKKPELRVYNKKNMDNRLEITAKAIVKYLDPEISSYFCTDHTFLMISKLDPKWIESINKKWLDALRIWKRKKNIKAKIPRLIYSWYKLITSKIDEKIERIIEKYDV